MPTYIRAKNPGGTFFLTFVSHKRRRFLKDSLALECLQDAYQVTVRRRRFLLRAYCVLPDHIHVLVTLPRGDDDFPTRCSAFKGAFTRAYLRAGGEEGQRNVSRYRSGEAAVWQRRYWEHAIRNQRDFERHFDYIHFNPVKHGLVREPGEWEWSTFRRYTLRGWYEADWGKTEPRNIRALESVGE